MQGRALRNLLVSVVTALIALLAPTVAHAAPTDQPEQDGAVVTVSKMDKYAPLAYDCPQWTFCAWDLPNAGGPLRLNIGGTISCGWGINLWNVFPAPSPDGWRDVIESIQNRTSGTWALLDYVNGQWVTRWTSVSGNWGNLPPSASNNVDRLVFVC